MEKKTIALDIGNVCVGVHPERCFRMLGIQRLEEIPREVQFLVSERFERGEISESEFLTTFRRMTGSALSDEELRRAFCAIIGDPLPGMVELVSELAGRGWRPIFFSDTSITHRKEVFRKFPAASAVPDGIYSYLVHAKKPELPMFEAFESRFGVPAFYFDDRAELVEAARKFGWNAYRFVSAEEVGKILG